MKTLSLDTNTMSPWADFHRLISNAKSLTVKAGGRTYAGEATLEDDGAGHLTLAFAAQRLVKAATKPGTVSRAKIRKIMEAKK